MRAKIIVSRGEMDRMLRDARRVQRSELATMVAICCLPIAAGILAMLQAIGVVS